ncbi:hypothetical protein JCGZ_10103 [Jatropha curcas]|uniref:Uncharacterized protein n=1 Tax=Jatropha curcas TaxID=180498 RepID=A0A067LG49_JATCU|nr:hypothetical protein JCGZ_10103 [Jatropha curcas]
MAVSLFSTRSSVRRRRGARRSTRNLSRPLSIRTVVGNGEISPAIEETKLSKEAAPSTSQDSIRVTGSRRLDQWFQGGRSPSPLRRMVVGNERRGRSGAAHAKKKRRRREKKKVAFLEFLGHSGSIRTDLIQITDST